MSTLMSLGPVWTAVSPLVVNYVVSPLVVAGVGYVALLLKRKYHINISAQAQRDLEQAAVNAAGRIAASQDRSFASMKIDVKSPLIAAEVPLVLKAAAPVLKATGEEVSNLILAKVGHAQVAMKA